MEQKYLVELFSNMPTCEVEDCKMAGDLIIVSSKQLGLLVAHMANHKVEFAISTIGECILDLSYAWWSE